MFLKLLITGGKWEFRLQWIFYKTKVLCHVKSHIQEPNCDFLQVYLEDNKKIKMFLERSLEYSQFTNRYSSVSQNNHPNRKQLSIDGAYRVRTLFEEEYFDVVLSADEFFYVFMTVLKRF